MTTYEDSLSLGAARERYFAASGFDASSYDAAFVPLVAGPIRFWLPNTAARVRAVRLHDRPARHLSCVRPWTAHPADALVFAGFCVVGEALSLVTLAPAIAGVVGLVALLTRG